MKYKGELKFISMGHCGDCYTWCFRAYNLPINSIQMRSTIRLHAMKLGELKELCPTSVDSNGSYCVSEFKTGQFALYRIK